MAGPTQIRRPPALILGPHIAALGVLRVLARRGIPAYVVDDTSNVIVHSRWYRRPERTLAETSDPTVLDEYLRSLRLPRAVLIACSDRWAQAVAGLPEATRERFPASIAPAEAIAQFVDKDRFRELVDRLDLPRPKTIPIGSAADLDHVSDADLLSGFLKPTESQRHNQRYHNKGFFIDSRAEAVRLVEEATRAGITFMLQEWIPGDPSKTYLIDGFVDGSGRITTMIARRRIRMDPPRLANTSSDVTVPLAEVEACIPSLQTLFEAVDYRGIFNVEFKLDERDGRFKIIEVNPRPFWLIGHVAAAGVDLPWMDYLDAQGVEVVAPPPYQVGRLGMYEIPDATAIARAVLHGRRPVGPIRAMWLHGDRALFWWRDPLPGAVGVGQIVARRVASLRDRLRRGAVGPDDTKGAVSTSAAHESRASVA
jgi:predicted ATP-grasp superfamily ATP-dependent carboligase